MDQTIIRLRAKQTSRSNSSLRSHRTGRFQYRHVYPRTIYPFTNTDVTSNNDGGMRRDELQGESRSWENRIPGLVDGVKAIPFVRRAFTLIERVPSKGNGN